MATRSRPGTSLVRRRPQSNDGAVGSAITSILRTLKELGVGSLHRQLAWIAAASFLSGFSQAILLVIISEFAVNTAQGGTHLNVHGVSISIAEAVLICSILLLVYLATGVAAARSNAATAGRALAAVRNRLIDAFFNANWRVQSQERLGHIQQLLTVNCEKVGDIAQGMAIGLQAFLTVLALLLAAFLVNPLAAVVVLVLGIVLSSVLRPFNRWGRNASFRVSENSHVMATLVTEYTRLTREFRLFGVEPEATAGLHKSNEVAARAYRHMKQLQQLTPVIYQTLALGFVVCAFAFVAGHTGRNLGAIAAVLLLMLRSLQYGSLTQQTTQQVRSASGFLDAIKLELDRFSENPQDVGSGSIPETFDVEVKDLRFSYDGRGTVLEDVSFSVPDGQVLGVVGRSGSGKTTLGQILLGMLRPEQGTAMIGDVPASGIKKGGGISAVALVAQDPVLLQGSIAFNISFFRDLRPDQIEAASRAAHLHEDVEAMPERYETPVGEGGGALSGGQRQRLAIARALAGAPRLLVLDEPTSAVDGRSETLIRETISELRGSVTSIVISHRLALVEDCDLLLVLDKGRVADFGPRIEVLARPAFRDVANAVAEDVDG